ncbi:MAG: serine/threonine protein phosphatase [Desulfobulbaceae bacterium]|nr:serine/threonine protein phosphatase [Desulfobulbaceae bacterium]MCK5404413.1 serine/threonine protein phosphatase [Desulfobulbaceae bacterium]
MKRTFVIGDIHGCSEALKALFQKITPDPLTDRIVFLGDYVDRGLDSKQVVSELLRLQSQFPDIIFLKGNHEQVFLNCLTNRDQLDFFLVIGGRRTLESYGVKDIAACDFREKIPPSHIHFLEDLLPYWEDEDYFYVHAGFEPGIHPTQQSTDWLFWSNGGRFAGVLHDFGKQVIYGHTVTDTPLIQPNKIGIDTGAVYGGALTCLILPEMEFISVPCKKYWPI